MADDRAPDGVVNLFRPEGTGPLWGMASNDLNATLLVWPAGYEVAEHTNAELDVLLIVLEGGGVAVIDAPRPSVAARSVPLEFRRGDQAPAMLALTRHKFELFSIDQSEDVRIWAGVCSLMLKKIA